MRPVLMNALKLAPRRLLELDQLRRANNTGLLHRAPEIVRLGKGAGALQVLGGKEDDHVVAIGGAPQEVQFPQPGLLARVEVGVVSAFPSVEVLDFVVDE